MSKKYPEIKGFSTDSRKMEPNFVFVALEAERDGHEFAADAVANGAVAVIASKPLEVGVPVLNVKNTLKALQTIAKFHRLRFEFPVVGITGSCGKTTTKEFISKLISWKKPLSTKGNLNNEIGVPLTLTRIDLRENMSAVIEAGVAAPNQMKPLAEMIEPDLAVITSVTPAHIEGFVELGNVAKEKALLAANVAAGGWALFHSSLLSWKSFEELTCKKAVLAPAEAPDIRADLVFRYSLNEAETFTRVDISIDDGKDFYFEIPRMSKGLTENALLAIAAALMLGTSEEQLAAKLPGLEAAPMRGAVIETEKARFYADCYNASPASMKDSLKRFCDLSENASRLFILGDMGELGLASHRYHKDIGESLPVREGDKAGLVGRNAGIYKTAMLESGWKEEDISSFENSIEALKLTETFEGWIFLKGSRTCELENALPNEVREKLSLEPQEIPEEEEDPIEEELAQVAEDDDSDIQDEDEFDDEGFDIEDEDFDDDGDFDEDENLDHDDEDERFND
jgi:UDP-N-acetylmuramoyl-tripeptide--D-alanyl-D-alanine ligase